MKCTRLLLCLCVSFSTLTFADERDDEVFGEDAKPAPPKLSILQDNNTVVGGRLSLDTAAILQEGGKIDDILYQYDTTVYAYLDARPNDVTRTFVRMRAIHPDPEFDKPGKDKESGSPRFDLDEGWIKVSGFDKKVFFTAGRQHLKWGTGRFWNPSDFLASANKDPLAVYDYRLGSNLFKIHYPMEKQGHNFYLIADFDKMSLYKKPGAAMRMEFAGKSSEISFTAYARSKKPSRIASDLSFDAGPVDIHLEVVFSTLNRNDFYRGEGSLTEPTKLEIYTRRSEWIPQIVTGVKYDHLYSESDHWSVELEYFYNGLGYKKRDLEFVALAKGDAAPLYAGQHYGGLMFALPNPGSLQDTSFYVSSLMNLSDKSGLVRLSTQMKFYKEILLELWGTSSFGETGEFRFKLPEGMTAASVQGPGGEPIPAVAVASGISKAVGASVSMNF